MKSLAVALSLLALTSLPALAQSKDAAARARVQVDGITNATLDRLWVEADRYWHEGDYYRIVDICRILIEGDPSDDEACSVGAYLLWSLGDTKAADWLLEYGSKRAPKNRGLFYQELGWHLYNTKRYQQALPYLQKATAAGGVPPTAYAALGHCYEKTGNLKASVQAWEELSKRFPTFPSWKPNLARVKAKLAAPAK